MQRTFLILRLFSRLFFVLFFFANFQQKVFSCILLLNGWKPVPLEERVALADIVVSGRVQATYKNIRSTSGTYKADVRILKVYKGQQQLNRVRPKNKAADHFQKPTPATSSPSPTPPPHPVYSISNFGDKISCYADVNVGKSYVFFLTTFQGHLSGKYDDIFGAALHISQELDSQILQILGWQEWGGWETCRRNCGGGSQIRRRICSQKSDLGCSGGQVKEERQCNLFPCKTVKNILRQFRNEKKESMTLNRPPFLPVKLGDVLCTSLSVPFPKKFLESFSLMFTAKFPNDTQGYPIAVSDSYGHFLFGLRINNHSLKFEHIIRGPLTRQREVVHLEENMSDGQWHQLAIVLQDRMISVFFDCHLKETRTLKQSLKTQINEEYILAIGSSARCYGSLLQGEISQLMISPDLKAGKQQCLPTPNQFSISNVFDNETNVEEETESTIQRPKEATSISPFAQTTAPRCSLVCLNGGECHPGISSSSPVCLCRGRYFGDRCQNASCSPGCFNGGECIMVGRCRCLPGFKGKLCRQGICDQPCQNGGHCVGPNLCKCRSNYTGRYCQQPLCERGCFHGGKCVAANVCLCRRGYIGRNCRKPICSPVCQNGGLCIYPNRCRCQAGTFGLFCEKFRCKPACSKERQCAAGNTCICKDNSPFCQKQRPLLTFERLCFNGRKCNGAPCGHCSSLKPEKRCNQRLKHFIVFKNFHRTIYRRHCNLNRGKQLLN